MNLRDFLRRCLQPTPPSNTRVRQILPLSSSAFCNKDMTKRWALVPRFNSSSSRCITFLHTVGNIPSRTACLISNRLANGQLSCYSLPPFRMVVLWVTTSCVLLEKHTAFIFRCAEVQPQVSPCGIFGRATGIDKGFLHVLRLSPTSSLLLFPHTRFYLSATLCKLSIWQSSYVRHTFCLQFYLEHGCSMFILSFVSLQHFIYKCGVVAEFTAKCSRPFWLSSADSP